MGGSVQQASIQHAAHDCINAL